VSRRLATMACLRWLLECGSWKRHLEGFICSGDREPREKCGEIGCEIETRVRGVRRGGCRAERIPGGEALQKSLGAGRQAAHLDVNPGTRDKRVLAVPIGDRRKLHFAG